MAWVQRTVSCFLQSNSSTGLGHKPNAANKTIASCSQAISFLTEEIIFTNVSSCGSHIPGTWIFKIRFKEIYFLSSSSSHPTLVNHHTASISKIAMTTLSMQLRTPTGKESKWSRMLIHTTGVKADYNRNILYCERASQII